MVKVPIVAMVIAAGMVVPGSARAQVSVNVNIGQPPPVIVAQPVLVPVDDSPVYYAPSYGPDLFFYEGRYYTVRDNRWFYAARLNTPWVAIAVGRVPRPIRTVPARYYRVYRDRDHHDRDYRDRDHRERDRFCPPGQAKKGRC